MTNHSSTTQIVQSMVDRLRLGDTSARDELIQAASERLMALTRKKKRTFRGSVAPFEQTEDVFQLSIIRLCKALEDCPLNDARHFFNLAALQIRRQLLDLKKHYQGPEKGLRANLFPQSANGEARNPAELAEDNRSHRGLDEFEDLYLAIDKLEAEQQEIVNLMWIHQLTQAETAELLGISERGVRRKWRAARETLFDLLSDVS